jgi:hypothetical protein
MNINDPTHPRSEAEFTALLLATFGPLRHDEDHIAGILARVWVEILTAHRTWPPREKEMDAASAKLIAQAIRCAMLKGAVYDMACADEGREPRNISTWTHALLAIFLAYRASREIRKLPRNNATKEPTP